MKNTQICPKCGGNHIIRVPDQARRHASGNNIYTSTLTLTGKIPVIRYLCTGCGYVENWVEHPDQREEIARRFG